MGQMNLGPMAAQMPFAGGFGFDAMGGGGFPGMGLGAQPDMSQMQQMQQMMMMQNGMGNAFGGFPMMGKFPLQFLHHLPKLI